MVVSYKNRFLKVFLISLGLFVVGIGGLLWITSSIYQITNSDISDSSLNNLKLLSYLFGSVLVVAEGLYFYSHYLLAKAKGYSGWLTLLAFINTIGIIILFLLPDKQKTPSLI